jgi:hypothetical protein
VRVAAAAAGALARVPRRRSKRVPRAPPHAPPYTGRGSPRPAPSPKPSPTRLKPSVNWVTKPACLSRRPVTKYKAAGAAGARAGGRPPAAGAARAARCVAAPRAALRSG